MGNLGSYLPTDKCDYDCICRLKTLKPEELQMIIPELLEWVQDINWPIAPKIIEILLPLDRILLPQIKGILLSGDYEWIQNCLWHMVKELKTETIIELKNELVMLSKSMDPQFIEYEIPQICKDIMSEHSINCE